MNTLGWIRTAGEILLVVAVVFGGLRYLERREDFARWEAMANQRAERIDSLRSFNDSLRAVKEEADSAAYMDSLRLAQMRDSVLSARRAARRASERALTRADTSANALSGTLVRLRARAVRVAPELVPTVDTARAQLDSHLEADSSVQAAFDRQMAAQVALTAERDSMARLNWRRWMRSEAESDGLRSELNEQREQTAFWKAKAEPSLFASIGSDAPIIVGAFALGATSCALLC